MIFTTWEIFRDALWEFFEAVWSWLVVSQAFQKIADKTEVGYVCPYCDKRRRRRYERCTGCGADLEIKK